MTPETEAKTKECKQDVFEDLLANYRTDECILENMEHGDKGEAEFEAEIDEWRERYDKAEIFRSGYHDVADLYDETPTEQENEQ